MTTTTTTTQKQYYYGEYINPTIDQHSTRKENPLVLMAQVCNNIGKELSLSPKQSSISIKSPTSYSPTTEGKKSLKRSAPSCSSPIPSTKKISISQSFYNPSIFDSLFSHYLSQISSTPMLLYNYSSFLSSFQQYPYSMDSTTLSSPFICNSVNSNIQDGFYEKSFVHHLQYLEHLCTEHPTIESSYLSQNSSLSIDKL